MPVRSEEPNINFQNLERHRRLQCWIWGLLRALDQEENSTFFWLGVFFSCFHGRLFAAGFPDWAVSSECLGAFADPWLLDHQGLDDLLAPNPRISTEGKRGLSPLCSFFFFIMCLVLLPRGWCLVALCCCVKEEDCLLLSCCSSSEQDWLHAEGSALI